MKLVAFDEVRQKLQPGAELPWNVRTAAGELLLAKGQIIETEGMLADLLERAAFFEPPKPARRQEDEQAVRESVIAATTLTSNWSALEARLSGLLRSPTDRNFLQRMQDTLVNVAATAQRHTDELIYLVLRHDHSRLNNYGIAHALHCAALCGLIARRLGWSPRESASVMGAALTMNISMLDLQGVLAASGSRPTTQERVLIDEHPLSSAELLRLAGVNDDDWLQTVEQHHEVPGGGGYPRKIVNPTEMSQLLRFIDIFSAKHSPRTGRAPLPAHQAARELFIQGKGNPLASVLIKEMGIYPPGCCVRLASGEIGIVTRVGATAKTPIVAAITNRKGDAMTQPLRRDTAQPAHAIVETVPHSAIRVHVSVDDLYDRRNS
ncbi:MAG: HD domain-containing phosphohydrolase [Pseudomonadota bacterium]